MTSKDYIAAEPGQLYWRYTRPTEGGGAKMLLLTIGGIAMTGRWEGEVGQYYVAWCPLPKRDRAEEQRQGIKI